MSDWWKADRAATGTATPWWEDDERPPEDEFARAAEDHRMLQAARHQIKRSSVPQVRAVLEQIRTGLESRAHRVGGSPQVMPEDDTADELVRLGNAYSQAIAETDTPDKFLPPIVRRGLRGVGVTVPETIVGGAIGGPFGAIGAAVSQEMNQAITEGRDAGLRESELAEYVMTKGAVEAGPAIAMQLLGLGGLESAVGKPAAKAIGKGVWDGLKRAGIATLEELPEEIVTELGHSVADAGFGIRPDAMDPEQLAQTVADTTVQTLLTMGVVETPRVLDAKAAAKKRERLLAELNEWLRQMPPPAPSGPPSAMAVAYVARKVDAGQAPSRADARLLGIPPKHASRASDRLKWFNENRKRLEQQGEVEPSSRRSWFEENRERLKQQAEETQPTEGLPWGQPTESATEETTPPSRRSWLERHRERLKLQEKAKGVPRIGPPDEETPPAEGTPPTPSPPLLPGPSDAGTSTTPPTPPTPTVPEDALSVAISTEPPLPTTKAALADELMANTPKTADSGKERLRLMRRSKAELEEMVRERRKFRADLARDEELTQKEIPAIQAIADEAGRGWLGAINKELKKHHLPPVPGGLKKGETIYLAAQKIARKKAAEKSDAQIAAEADVHQELHDERRRREQDALRQQIIDGASNKATAQDILVGDTARVADDVRRGRMTAEEALRIAEAAVDGGLIPETTRERLREALSKETVETSPPPTPPIEPEVPAEPLPPYKRTTPREGAPGDRRAHDQEMRDRAWERERELSERRKQLIRQRDGTRKNAHKKRREIQQQIDELDKQISEIHADSEIYADRLSLARIEDAMEEATSEAQRIAGQIQIAEIKRRDLDRTMRRSKGTPAADRAHEQIRQIDEEIARLQHNLQAIFLQEAQKHADRFNPDEIDSIAERAFRDFRVSYKWTVAEMVEVEAKRQAEIRPKSLPRLEGLSEAQQAAFNSEMAEAADSGPGWYDVQQEIRARAEKVAEAGREELQKAAQEAREAAAAQAQKKAAESLKIARQRARTEGLEPRYWQEMKKRAQAIKGKKEIVEISTPDGKKKVFAKILNEFWAITRAEDSEGKTFYGLTHIPTGIAAWTYDKEAEAKQRLQLTKELGFDVLAIEDPKELTSENYVLIRAAGRAFDNNSIAELTGEQQQLLLGLIQTPPANVDADMVLDSYDLGAHTTKDGLTNKGIKTVKDLVETVPEFAYDPVFTVEVKGDQADLIYQDGYKFRFPSHLFNLHPSELRDGQTVGVNLGDLGIARKTQADVVAETLKNQGLSKVSQKKKGKVVAGLYRGAKIEVTRIGTEETPQWTVTQGADKPGGELANRAIQAIRWRQPAQEQAAPAAGEVEAEPAERTETEAGQAETKTGQTGTESTGGEGTVHAQQMPAGAQPGETEFETGEAPFETAAPQPDPKAERINAQPMPLPELIQLVKTLLGSFPAVQRLKRYLGFFQHDRQGTWARMVINAISAKNEVLLAKVIAHEAGHLIDWLPDRSMDRGNILGRIASLRNYLEGWLAGKPGGPGPLTEAERDRLRREAKRVLQQGAEVEIEEEIVERYDITPQDILNIWNSLTADVPADLLRYVKRLSAAEKLSLVKEAMRGVVPAEVQQFAKEVRRKTGRKIKQTIAKDATSEEIAAKYRELLEEEIRKRMLLSNEIIRDELIRLTEWWSPYDKRTASKSYIRYRESAAELYAEALSVFFNSPLELARRAPEFYRGFAAYLGEKPEMYQAFMDVQAILNGGEENVSEIRRQIREDMFLEGEAALAELEMQREAAKRKPLKAILHFLNQYILQNVQPIKARAKKSNRDKALAAFYTADELAYSENRNYVMVRQITEEIFDPLRERGITEQDIGDYLFMRRVVDERNELANPLGYTPTESAKEIKALKDRLGEDRFNFLDQTMQRWHDIIFESALAAVESGIYSRDTFERVIVPKKDSYAAFWVIKHIEGEMDPEIFAQIGTFEGIANPWMATMMKMISLNRLIELNNAKRAVRNFLYDEPAFHKEIRRIDEPKGKRPKPGFAYIQIMENGRSIAYEVPDEIAASFKRHDIGRVARFAAILQSGLYKVFHPLFVTFSPGFIAANPVRDLRRTWANLGSMGTEWNRELRRELIARGMSPAEARKAASRQKITLGQVLWAFWKARKAATAHLIGTEDPRIEEMMRHKALSTPYVDVAAEIGETTQARKIMAKYGLVDMPKKDRGRILAGIGKVLEWIKLEGGRQEVAGKLAAWELITERMRHAQGLGVDLISERKRAYITRRYAGTPDFKQKGLFTPISNTVLMYSNVAWQGLLADFELATDPKTAAGWWWRRVIGDIIPKTLEKLVLYGAFDAAVQAILRGIGGDDEEEEKEKKDGWAKKTLGRVASYYLDNYDVIPIGTVHDATGAETEAKSIFFTIPKDETGRLISRVWGALMDVAYEAAGGDTRAGYAGKAAEKAFGAVIDGILPNESPPIEMAGNWALFLSGVNPRDSFFDSEIVPPGTFQAGGWASYRKMLGWTATKFGVAGDATHFLTGAVTGKLFQDRDETTLESVLNLPTGLNRYLRISDRGIDEEQWLQIELEERESAKFKQSLPPAVRRMTTEYWKLARLDKAKMHPELRTKAHFHKQWYYNVYLPLTQTIKAAKNEDKKKRLRAILQERTKAYQKRIEVALRKRAESGKSK